MISASRACAQISKLVQRAQTDNIYGLALDKTTGQVKDVNVQGEAQMKLDVVCNDILTQAFCGCGGGRIAAVASEEDADVRTCRDTWHVGTGTDGKPEWDRFKITKDKLKSFFSENIINNIEREEKNWAQSLIKRRLQKL